LDITGIKMNRRDIHFINSWIKSFEKVAFIIFNPWLSMISAIENGSSFKMAVLPARDCVIFSNNKKSLEPVRIN